MKNELQTLRLFSPLFPHICPFNEWGDLENDMVEMEAGELLRYTDEIQALIQKAQLPSEDKHGLAIYIHDESLSRKVSSIYPGVEEHGGELWCVTEVKEFEDGEEMAAMYTKARKDASSLSFRVNTRRNHLSFWKKHSTKRRSL